MGIKMSQFKYNGEVKSIKDYSEIMKENISCCYCGVPITYVRDHKRDIVENQVSIPAYFRLRNKETHKDDCDFITLNRIKKIYAKCSDNNEIMTKIDNKYIVRLHLVRDNFNDIKNGVTTEGGKITKAESQPTREYIKKGDMSVYLSTINEIMRLRNDIEYENDLKNSLFLTFYNTKEKKYDEISWKNFFIEYNKEDYYKAHQNILRKKVFYPICFSGCAKTIEDKKENFDWYSIKCYSIKSNNHYIAFSILFNDYNIFQKYKDIKDKNFIVYGGQHYAKETAQYLNISTKIYSVDQILLLN